MSSESQNTREANVREGQKGFVGSALVFCGQVAAIWIFLDWMKKQEKKYNTGRER